MVHGRITTKHKRNHKVLVGENKRARFFSIPNRDGSREEAGSLKINDSTAIRSYGHSFI